MRVNSQKESYNIPIAKPYFSGSETERIAEVMESGWVCQGPMVANFERAVASYTGAKYAVATSSCTTALHIAMLVNDIGPGDDVICPSYSFIATANGITYSGARPRFVDIDPLTLNIDPLATKAFIEANYTPQLQHKETGNRLKGILVVHQIGIPADIDALQQIAGSYGLTLMEDSACAIGSSYKGKPIGSSGNIGTLSFHPRKVISSGEGGMLLTDDHSKEEMARVLRAHGASISDFDRHKSGSASLYESYNVLGFNYRMTDIHAAVGLAQLERLDYLIERRRLIASRFNEAFAQIPQLEIIDPPEYVSSWNYQSYPIRLAFGTCIERDDLMGRLLQEGIATRRGIPPIHKEPVYEQGLRLPNTESVSERSLFLPIFPQLTEQEVEHIIRAVSHCVQKGLSTVRV